MSGYTGAPRRNSPEDVSSLKIRTAGGGKHSNMLEKLEMVIVYIRQEALLHHNGDATRVPCPSRDEWAVLAAGRGGVLPNEAQLALYANGAMRKLAERYGGDMRQAYFALAQHKIAKQSQPSG